MTRSQLDSGASHESTDSGGAIPGVVHQDVDASEPLGRLGDQSACTRLGRDVADHEMRLIADLLDQSDGLLGAGVVEIGDHDVRALRATRSAIARPNPALPLPVTIAVRPSSRRMGPPWRKRCRATVEAARVSPGVLEVQHRPRSEAVQIVKASPASARA